MGGGGEAEAGTLGRRDVPIKFHALLSTKKRGSSKSGYRGSSCPHSLPIFFNA